MPTASLPTASGPATLRQNIGATPNIFVGKYRAKTVKKGEDWKWSSARANIKGMRDDILGIS